MKAHIEDKLRARVGDAMADLKSDLFFYRIFNAALDNNSFSLGQNCLPCFTQKRVQILVFLQTKRDQRLAGSASSCRDYPVSCG